MAIYINKHVIVYTIYNVLHLCISFALFSPLVHSNEENDVLQHACAYCSEEPGWDPTQFDGEEENYVTVPRRMHQNTESRPQECMYNPWNILEMILTAVKREQLSSCGLQLQNAVAQS